MKDQAVGAGSIEAFWNLRELLSIELLAVVCTYVVLYVTIHLIAIHTGSNVGVLMAQLCRAYEGVCNNCVVGGTKYSYFKLLFSFFSSSKGN